MPEPHLGAAVGAVMIARYQPERDLASVGNVVCIARRVILPTKRRDAPPFNTYCRDTRAIPF